MYISTLQIKKSTVQSVQVVLELMLKKISAKIRCNAT